MPCAVFNCGHTPIACALCDETTNTPPGFKTRATSRRHLARPSSVRIAVDRQGPHIGDDGVWPLCTKVASEGQRYLSHARRFEIDKSERLRHLLEKHALAAH